MSAALVIVYACLATVEVAVVVAWILATRRHRWPVRPASGDVVIGGVTSFLDTLGIGNYAQITAPCSVKTYGEYFRCRPRPVFKAPIWHLKEPASSAVN